MAAVPLCPPALSGLDVQPQQVGIGVRAVDPGGVAGSGWAGKEERLGKASCLLVADTPHLARVAVTHRHPWAPLMCRPVLQGPPALGGAVG